MKFAAAFSMLAYYQATSAFTSSPAFASKKASTTTTTHLGSSAVTAGTDVYTFAKSEEIFAEAQEVRF